MSHQWTNIFLTFLGLRFSIDTASHLLHLSRLVLQDGPLSKDVELAAKTLHVSCPTQDWPMNRAAAALDILTFAVQVVDITMWWRCSTTPTKAVIHVGSTWSQNQMERLMAAISPTGTSWLMYELGARFPTMEKGRPLPLCHHT
jgi:hypothetical protein